MRRVLLLLTCFSLSLAQNLTDAQVAIVVDRLATSAKQSWELGTRAQALIELDTPTFSVLNNTPVPPSTSAPSSLSDVLTLAHTIVANRSTSNNGAVGPQPFIADGAAGDPASVGVAVLLANWTGQGNSSIDYAGAATDQINFLFQKVPQTSDGAISHRTEQVQLWSDFVYMVPPFLAYYGVVTQNQSMVEEAYTQVKLYRTYLRGTSKSSDVLWKHIVMGTGIQDDGFWSTGNGWAAAGMLRVLGTIKNSQYASAMKNEQKDLGNWINEIHNAIYPHIQSNNLFLNYANDTSSFSDAASTALLTATVYRAALLYGTHTHLPAAEKSRQTLSAPAPNTTANGTTLAGLTHFTDAGYLTPVVNPESFGAQLLTTNAVPGSPEAQAFVVEMHAAWRDWVQNGAPGASGAARMGAPSAALLAFGALGVMCAMAGVW